MDLSNKVLEHYKMFNHEAENRRKARLYYRMFLNGKLESTDYRYLIALRMMKKLSIEDEG
jgi:hypothetical protein